MTQEELETKLPPINVLEGEIMPARLCPYCKVVSNFGRLFATGADSNPAPDGETRGGEEISLCNCPNCNAVVYYRTPSGGGGTVIDQYPQTVERASTDLPDPVRKALDEALLCYGAGSPNGTLLMCRRALQETMNDKKAKKGDLPTQLEDLVSRQEITPKLRDWATQSQIGGRIAAHGSGGELWGDPDKIWGTMDDARIVIEYLNGFFEYVYVLAARIKNSMKDADSPASQSKKGSNES